MKCARIYLWLCFFYLVSGQLEPVLENDQENQYILRVIKFTERHLKFNQIITYMGKPEGNVQGNPIIIFPVSLQQRIVQAFGRPVIVAGTEIGTLVNVISSRSLAIVFFYILNDSILQTMHNTLPDLHYISLIFVYKNKDEELPLLEFFSWCSKLQLKRLVLVLGRNNSYETWTYTGVSNIQSMLLSDRTIDNGTESDFQKFIKLFRYRSLVTVFDSLPSVFLYNSSDQHDLTGGNVSLGGGGGLLLTEFLRFAKGKMEILSGANRMDLENKLGNRTIDIAANLVTDNKPNLNEYSPSVLLTKSCILVPYASPLPLKYYFYHCIKLSLMFFVVFIILMNTILKRLIYPHSPLILLLLRSFEVTVGNCLSSRAFRRLRLPDKFMELSTQIYTLLITSITSSALTMALTIGYHEIMIENAVTLLESGLRIMIDQKQMQLFEQDILPSCLKDRLIVVDKEIKEKHLLELNESYAYVVDTLKWNQLAFMQERLRQPKLRLASPLLCGNYQHLRLYIRQDLPYVFMLRKFIDSAREAGIIDKWIRMGRLQAQRLGRVRQLPYETFLKQFPLPLEFYERLSIIYFCGLLLSFIVFLLELAHDYWYRRHFDISQRIPI